jgi:pimeloyl-ACP methyl ester carboxylesterase
MRRLARVLGLLLVGVIALALLAVGGLSLFRRPLREDLARETAIRSPSGIESLERIDVRGDLQWIFLRGEDRGAPVLLVVHGGPGSAQLPITRQFDRDLVRHFVVVHWDQPGAGKSLGWDLRPGPLVLDRYVEDAITVAEYLRASLGHDRLVLLGHSWGTVVGTRAVALRPDLFAAWVSVGTDVIPAQAEEIGYRWVLGRARSAGHVEAVEALEAIGPPPYQSLLDVKTERDWLEVFGGASHRPENEPGYLRRALSSPEYSSLDLLRLVAGNLVGPAATFWDYLESVNLLEQAPRLEVPVFFLQGRHDYNTPAGLVERYYEVLEAPRGKHLVWFEESAHRPHLEETEKFARVLIEEVLPLARRARSVR